MVYEIIRPGETSSCGKDEIANFLFEHLDQFGDPKEDIEKCLNYALSTEPNKGGYVVLATEHDQIAGAVVINSTAMKDYIPGNILVYIAVHKSFRGKGLGKELMQRAFDEAEGDVALHVEPDNPACKLYERMGMTHKYLEYRWKKA